MKPPIKHQAPERDGEHAGWSGLPVRSAAGAEHARPLPGPANQPAGPDNHRDGCGHTPEAQPQVCQVLVHSWSWT